jgi:parallel beta-helix repeat protein
MLWVWYVNRGASAFILLFVLCSAFVLLTEIGIVYAGGTIYIRIDGSIEGTSKIQRDGNVYTFTYDIYDSIVVEINNIVIDGNGYTLLGYGTGTGIYLSGRENVTVRNTQIKAFADGISLYSSSNNNSISGNNIANSYIGIRLDSSSNNSISGNNIANNAYGIYLYSSSNNSISGNNMTANSYDGISLYSSSNNSISGNTFFNGGLTVAYSYGNVVVDNLVNGRPLVYLEGVSDFAVDDAGQVILVNCNNILVENLNLSHTNVGVQLWGTNNTKISENNIANNYYGIYLDSSSNYNSISENSITNSYDGIRLYYSSNNNSISGNNIANNIYGIYLEDSSNNSISGNNIANNGYGICVFYSSNYNSISGNNITANNYYGIWLYYSSNYNSISGNSIANNYYGISLEDSSNYNSISGNIMTANSYDGIRLDYSSNNLIYHNNFIGNAEQVYSTGSVNVWDVGYPSGGNYWSDYSGVDLNSGPYQNETGSDGIGDTNYTISTGNNDRYPLMGPISTFDCGTWDNKPYYADVVSNSTISAFNLNAAQKLISFNVNGSAGTMGFCKITIDNLLLGGPYTVLVDGTPVTPSVTSNGTHSSLYFTYAHSTHNVTIIGTLVIPDSHSSLGLLMVMFVAMSALLYMKKKRLAS